MINCEVCTLQKQNAPEIILFENADWVIVLRPDDQTYIGMCVVSLKQHIPAVSELTDKQWLSFAETTRWAETHISDAFSPTHYNWMCLMNLGAATGVTHVHWHCVPRYDRTISFADLDFIDKDWPNAFYPMGEKRQVDKEALGLIVEKIKAS